MNQSILAAQKYLDSSPQTVSWFESRLRNNELLLKPPFQRNPVWTETQSSYLIDTILRGFPIPEIYLQMDFTPEGIESYTVVDGQQRIRACLDFIAGRYTLQLPDTDWDGLTFDQLTGEERLEIRRYRFVVRMLPVVNDELLREIFGRLNRNNVSLTRQELRQATYWGEFISTINSLAENSFWVNSGLFTANDIRRMADREYISELALAVLFGPQNKKSTLDKYYADFEEEFPRKDFVKATFDHVLDYLAAIFDGWKTWNRWSKKSDFYTLFSVMARIVMDTSSQVLVSRLDEYRSKLEKFSEMIDSVLSFDEERVAGITRDSPALAAYARAVQRAASDLASRRTRAAALESYLLGYPFVPPTSARGYPNDLPAIPSAPPVSVVEQESDEDE